MRFLWCGYSMFEQEFKGMISLAIRCQEASERLIDFDEEFIGITNIQSVQNRYLHALSYKDQPWRAKRRLMTRIDAGSLTAQTVGNPADQITTNMTGAKAKLTAAMKTGRLSLI